MLDKRIEKAEEVLKNAKENVKGRYRLGYQEVILGVISKSI